MQKFALAVAMMVCVLGEGGWCAAQMAAHPTAQEWMDTMVAHENAATAQRGHYVYLNEERSDRTGGHLWRERVAETDWGLVRYLLAEDEVPLSADRANAEKARLADEAARPEAFRQNEQARVDNEQHARQMLTLLPKAFLFSEPKLNGDEVEIDFMPNPAFQPATMEEKVLHAMSGKVLIDDKAQRLREVDGHTSQDLSLSFGLASVKAGSNFQTVRVHEVGPDWKMESVHSDIRGKAFFMKLARKQDSKHSEFRKIPDNTTVASAVAMLEAAGMN